MGISVGICLPCPNSGPRDVSSNHCHAQIVNRGIAHFLPMLIETRVKMQPILGPHPGSTLTCPVRSPKRQITLSCAWFTPCEQHRSCARRAQTPEAFRQA